MPDDGSTAGFVKGYHMDEIVVESQLDVTSYNYRLLRNSRCVQRRMVESVREMHRIGVVPCAYLEYHETALERINALSRFLKPRIQKLPRSANRTCKHGLVFDTVKL